ncbi:MAG: tetratricopeptide repeat protein [Bacteroidales bacterium]|nr:tetratricopeptide repeat protein [Bacteroidales bacterium]
MKKLTGFFFLAVTVSVMLSCSSQKDKLDSQIKALEQSLFSDENKTIDRTKARELIDAYVQFAADYSKDARAPEYLFKAGDMAMNMNMPHKAIEIFDKIMNNYPDYEKTPQCLFLKGYVYENDLKDLDMAKKIYEEFLQKYPDDEFADDAEISIKNLGKSPEDLIREFEEQAKKEGGV